MLAGDGGRARADRAHRADLVLNAIVGIAGLGPTIVALSEGIDLALANKESLVVGGELVTALAEATEARILPVDSEHSAIFQLLRGEGAGDGRAPDPDRVGRAVSRPQRPRRGDAGGGARAPDLGDGRADHDRLGDADEQGPRGDRGPSPVRRALRGDRRRRPPAVDRPLADRAQRRRPARPPRPARHARADLLRAALPRARRRHRAEARPRRASGSWTSSARTWTRSPACAWRARPGGAGGTAPCALNAADEVAVAAFLDGEIPFTAIAEVIAGTLDELGSAPVDPLRAAVRVRRPRPRGRRALVQRAAAV